MGAGTSALFVAVPGEGAGGPVEVRPGHAVTFGRGVAGQSVDVPLDDPAGEPVAGRIRAADGFWLITNLSRLRSYVVENAEGGGEYLRVPPGRLDMPVPFTHARVMLPSADGLLSLTVTAPAPAYLDVPAPPGHPPDQMAAAFSLDCTAKYFLVLVALCEPRLGDASNPAIPGTREIVQRLRGLESCRSITQAAVNFHIDYLARRKLRVRTEQLPGTGPRVNWQREAVVSTALRFGVVRDEHLALLAGP
ncbi:serine/threonine protein kinase [Kitasatospora sp. NPDC050543]|uniref:serine/threonine protein kinase n=1 Tax=Kitasatospora sp. NPDC050543 TaxID=3364054 RepID=UPI00378D07F1